jgi:hypothetical protein
MALYFPAGRPPGTSPKRPARRTGGTADPKFNIDEMSDDELMAWLQGSAK